MEQTSLNLACIADALDAYPSLEEYDRAVIFSAVDLAPAWWPEDTDEYMASPAYAAWTHARSVMLSERVDLHEAAGFASIVTKDDILEALNRGLRLIS